MTTKSKLRSTKPTKSAKKKPVGQEITVRVNTPAWADCVIQLTRYQDNQWSAGYQIGVGELLQADDPVTGSYTDRSAATAGACSRLLTVLHRQLEILSVAGDKNRVRALLAAVRKFRAKHETRTTPAGLVGEQSGAMSNANGHAEPRSRGQSRIPNQKSKPSSSAPSRLRVKSSSSTALVPVAAAEPPAAKGARGLLEDFRRSYETFERSWLELGEKAIQIRESGAYRADKEGLAQTFDEWIAVQKFDRSVVYGCMKGARVHRLFAPHAEPRHIVLDREGHFRQIPADVQPAEVKAIVAQLAKSVRADEDGQKRPTAKDIKAAVDAALDRPQIEKCRLKNAKPQPALEAKHAPVDDLASSPPDRNPVIDMPSASADWFMNDGGEPVAYAATIESAIRDIRGLVLGVARKFEDVAPAMAMLRACLEVLCDEVHEESRPAGRTGNAKAR